jgi:hypothetical protein
MCLYNADRFIKHKRGQGLFIKPRVRVCLSKPPAAGFVYQSRLPQGLFIKPDRVFV